MSNGESVVWVEQQGAQYARVPVWLLRSGVSDRGLRLYTVLAGIYAGMPDMYPSRKRLAEDMGCSDRTVDAAIDDLLTVGALRVEQRFGDDGGRRSNRYILAFNGPFDGTPSRTEPHPPANEPARGPAQNVAQPPPKQVSHETDKRTNQINDEPERTLTRATATRPDWLEAPLPRSLKVDRLLAIEDEYARAAPREWVRERINLALNHKAVDKAKNAGLYLTRWLDRDLKDERTRPELSRDRPRIVTDSPADSLLAQVTGWRTAQRATA